MMGINARVASKQRELSTGLDIGDPLLRSRHAVEPGLNVRDRPAVRRDVARMDEVRPIGSRARLGSIAVMDR